MNAFLAIVLAGAGTYLMRASFLAILGDGHIPPVVARSLRYVGPAVFAAIVLPRVLGSQGFSAFTSTPRPEMVAAVFVGAVAFKTRHVPTTLVLGMTALWLLKWVGL